jgi:hypothetical protein
MVRFPRRLTLELNRKNMNVLKSMLLCGSVAALTLFTGNSAQAQGRNFDPAQFRQMRVDRAREQLEIKDDTEWKAIEPIVGKVIDAQRDVMGSRMGGMFGRGGGRRNRGGDDNSTNNADQGQRRNRPSPFGEPSEASAALQKAIDDKAPAAELKEKMTAVRAERKDKEAKLQAAEEDLKGVLTARQEAIAVANGLLQ